MSTTSQGRSVMAQGRIVWTVGDLFTGRIKTDMQTRQPIMDTKTGQPKKEYGFGLAIPKSTLSNEATNIWMALHEEAASLFPSRQVPPGFAMKFKDGDGIDDKGRPFSDREGYAGCIVLACTTSLPIKFYRYENGQNFLINEGIKCGDYVNVQVSIKAHPAVGTAKAGLYVNPNAVQFLGYGKEIVNAPSGDQIFGAVAPVVPQGASATPIAPPGFIAPPGGQAVAPQAQPAYQQPMMAPAPQAAPAPNYGVLPPAYQPPAGNAPAPAAVPPIASTPQYGAPTATPVSPSSYPQAPQGFPQVPGMPAPR